MVSAFNYGAPAELFTSKAAKRPIRYTRFKSAAEAIRYAVEKLPAELLMGSTLEVNEERFDGFGIRELYESPNYPFPRKRG
jgi:Arc/MetJ-type ribon-helix-helix transcriptional regulator